MKPIRWTLWKGTAALLLFLFAASCSKDPAETVLLTAVQVQETSLVLPEGGTADLNFRVTDKEYAFVSDPAATDCEISLVTADNHDPVHFRLVRVARQGEAGTWLATLADNGSGDEYQEEIHLKIRRRDGTAVLSGRIQVCSEEKPADLAPDTGLPVIFIDTQAAITSKEDYVDGTLRIDGRGVADGLEEVTCQVRGRGNTTWTWPKKPYLVKLDQKASLFGMPKHKRWILLANFLDRTMMRNIIAMKVASMTSLTENITLPPSGASPRWPRAPAPCRRSGLSYP